MPSRNNYGETHSCSSFYDFQAPLKNPLPVMKMVNRNFVYTLNNTAVATPRVLIPLIENHQTTDGRIKIQRHCKNIWVVQNLLANNYRSFAVIACIWDYYGPDSKGTAEHFEKTFE